MSKRSGWIGILQDGAAVENGVFIIPLSANLAATDVAAAELDAAESNAPRSSFGLIGTPGSKVEPTTSLEFIAGSENQLAAVAIDSLLRERPSRFNPLVIVGPPLTGKTHLARGLADCWSARHALLPASVAYFTASDFAHELDAAIKAETTGDFQRRVREASLLVIEDLTLLRSRHKAQLELVHSLDAVVNQGGQVVITSSTPPERIAGLSADLRSRLAAGLLVPLMPPASATRLAIVNRLAGQRSISITASAARALAEGLSGTVPELLGALLELDVGSQLALGVPHEEEASRSKQLHQPRRAHIEPRTIDLRAVRQWLDERRCRLQPSLRAIASLAAKYFGLRVAELISPSRRRGVVQARAIAMYLGRQLTAKSLQQLGRYFGGRDHTTVLHSYRSIEARLQSDPATRRAISDLRKALAHAGASMAISG